MSILGAFHLYFKDRIHGMLQEERVKEYSVVVQQYVNVTLRQFANDYPELCLTAFMDNPPPGGGGGGGQSGDGMFLNLYLLAAAIDAAYLDIYYPNEFHDQEEGGPSSARHAAAVMAWLNRYKPLQIRSGIREEWAVFINALLALQVGLTIKMKMDGSIGSAQELTWESKKINDLVYVLHWRSPDYKQLTALLQFVC